MEVFMLACGEEGGMVRQESTRRSNRRFCWHLALQVIIMTAHLRAASEETQVGKTMGCLEQGMAVKRRWWRRRRTRWQLLDTQRQRLETVSKPKWLTEVGKEGEVNVPIHSKLLKSLKCLWIWEGECEQLKSACFIIEPPSFSVKSNSKMCCNCSAIRYV